MDSPTLPPRWHQAPHLLRQVGDGLMLLAPASDGEPVLLNGSARLIWDCLIEPATVDELAADIVDHFDADPDSVRTSIQTVIDQLAGELLVVGEKVEPA
ncbi:MAG: PqqD family protein [Actinomycetia bacterium]|nr:PqqD family protein [Actinomycetes bacterium]